jgi:hypothetical protein
LVDEMASTSVVEKAGETVAALVFAKVAEMVELKDYQSADG